MKNVLKQSINN